MKCNLSVIQSTNTRIESLPLETGRFARKSRDNPLQRDEDPEFWSTAVLNEGCVIVFKTTETKGSRSIAGASCNDIYIVGYEEQRAMIRNNIGVHSDEVGKQSVDRHGE